MEEVFGKASARTRVAADGGKENRTLEGWDALSVNDEKEAEWKPIEAVVRHETDKPVVRLQHKFGESTTTRDHSYVVEEDNALVERKPSEVEEPLRIPEVPDLESIDVVDVYEVLRGYERDYVDTRGGSGRRKTKSVHTDGENVWFGHESDGEKESTIKVQRFVEVGSEDCRSLLRLLGVYAADGSASTEETSKSKFGASISSSDAGKLDTLKSDYYRLFENVTVCVTASDTKNERTLSYETQKGSNTVTYDDKTKKLQMMNELSAVFFREFAGQTSRGKRVPEFVYRLPGEEQAVFLNALVGGDGSRTGRGSSRGTPTSTRSGTSISRRQVGNWLPGSRCCSPSAGRNTRSSTARRRGRTLYAPVTTTVMDGLRSSRRSNTTATSTT
jgi:DNA polymerase I